MSVKPQDMVVHDLKYEEALKQDTLELANVMHFSEQLCAAAYQVADYIPDLQDGENAAFWKEKVIPSLVKSLTQDVEARNVVVQAMSSVRDLAITIQKSGEIVKGTRGTLTDDTQLILA